MLKHWVEELDTMSQTPTLSEYEGKLMIEEYTPLVRQIVGGFQRRLPRNVLRDDLLAAGMFGLWDAIRRHGAERGENFEWYVRVRIRGAILDELRTQDWLPRRARDKADHNPHVVHFEDVCDWEHSRIGSCEANSEELLEQKSNALSVSRAVEQLPERERHIVASHYFQGVKFKDLGTELGVSEPRISQLHSRAMKRLQEMVAA